MGYVLPGAGPNITTVSPTEFQQLQSDLMVNAQPVNTPASYNGSWYQLPDGSTFGIRNSAGSGVTIDVISSPTLPPGFKVHQQ